MLDYSSLRFDFALTGRPMLFLVPDLDRYTGGVRGFLYDFEDSAPGPLLHHADGVVERSATSDRVAARSTARRTAFNQIQLPAGRPVGRTRGGGVLRPTRVRLRRSRRRRREMSRVSLLV